MLLEASSVRHTLLGLPMNTETTRVFPSSFDSLTEMSEFVGRAAQDAGLEPSAVYAVQMAVDEASSNIIEHAYGGDGDQTIECTCRVTDDGLTVILRDHGCPFDPGAVPAPDLEAELQDRCAGGLGIYFIRQLMDRVCFEFSERSGNTLTLVKRRETPPWPIVPK